MRSATTLNFDFGLGWNFGVENVFLLNQSIPAAGTIPPITNGFLLLNNGYFLLLNGNNLTLL